MHLFRHLRWACSVAVALLASPAYAADTPLPVVTSFSILGDIVREVGAADIALTTLVGPDGDAHTYEPTPADVRKLAAARVLFVNGLDFETWLPRLLKSAGFAGTIVTVSNGVTPRVFAQHVVHHHPHHHHHHDHQGGDVDPHAWQNLANGVIYTRNVAEGLAAADPTRAVAYRQRADSYIAKLEALHERIKTMLAAIPAQRRKVLTSHDAFGYFGDAYGVTFIAATGSSGDAEPSAAELAALITQVKREKVAAVFVENMTSPKLVAQIARETGARAGGTLYSDALSKPGEPAATYLGMCEWNAKQLVAALQP